MARKLHVIGLELVMFVVSVLTIYIIVRNANDPITWGFAAVAALFVVLGIWFAHSLTGDLTGGWETLDPHHLFLINFFPINSSPKKKYS